MSTALPQQSNLTGAICAFIAAICFSLNDVGIKFLSDDYALHQVVFVRGLVGLATLIILIMPFCMLLWIRLSNEYIIKCIRCTCVSAHSFQAKLVNVVEDESIQPMSGHLFPRSLEECV